MMMLLPLNSAWSALSMSYRQGLAPVNEEAQACFEGIARILGADGFGNMEAPSSADTDVHTWLPPFSTPTLGA